VDVPGVNRLTMANSPSAPWFFYDKQYLPTMRQKFRAVTVTLLAPVALSQPIASLAVSIPEGWDTTSTPLTLNFGFVPRGTSAGRQIRLCNTARDNSPLTITRSIPPRSSQLTAANPSTEFTPGQVILAGKCAFATVAVLASPSQPNRPTTFVSGMWVLGTDGKDGQHPDRPFGIRGIRAEAILVTRQVGPLLPPRLNPNPSGEEETRGWGDGTRTARYQWTGCFRDTPTRNLPFQINSTPAQLQGNTNGVCQARCFAAGYVFAGTEYAQECWCGDAIANPASYRLDDGSKSLNLCDIPCTGDPNENCGGQGGYMSLYADITRFDIPRFLSSVSGSSATPTPGPGPGSGGSTSELWTYTACLPASSLPTLKFFSTSSLTLQLCAGFCTGYNYFGLQSSTQCLCGDVLSSSTSREQEESRCDMSCGGDAAQKCGGVSSVSVYKNRVQTPSPPSLGPGSVGSSGVVIPGIPARAGSYVWLGCYREVPGRVLRGPSRAVDAMTVGMCGMFCSEEDTRLMGVEYGRECFCGDKLIGETLARDVGECDMQCAGNKSEFCGAADRLGVYTYSR